MVIDMINTYDHPDAEQLRASVKATLPVMVEQIERAREDDMLTIYVNDNFGRWRSNLKSLVSYCLESKVRGQEIVKRLRPAGDDYFILKPKHSGFYSTPLQILLEHLGASRLIITGLTADSCVMFTANDAYVRGYELYIPEDCVASIEKDENEESLQHMHRVLRANITSSTELDLARLTQR
jgi:nicotinamidase-related amidase